jgi:tRNA-dihydrouridine synthase B
VAAVGDSVFAGMIRAERLLLPPLAGYTDYPYRRIMAAFDPPFIVTEMVSASAIIHGGEKTRRMLARIEGARCEGVQLVGTEPPTMGKAAKVVEELGFDYVDINMGCTINKVTRQGAGVALMGDEERAQQIAETVVNTVAIPVTCKMRLGLKNDAHNAVSLSKRLEDVGVSAVTVHGRTGEKKWGMPVDFEGIRRVVEAVSIPVVANGGAFTGADAMTLMEGSGAAAVMPGRGIIGNPWLVPEIKTALSKEEYTPPTIAEKKSICLQHLDYLREYYGDRDAAIHMRTIFSKYFSGCQNIRSLHHDIYETSTPAEVAALIDRIEEHGSKGVYNNR